MYTYNTDSIWGTHTQRSDGWCITWWYQKCNTWPHYFIIFFRWWYGRGAGAEEYSAVIRSVCKQSCADIVHNRWANVELSRPWRAKPRRSNRRDQGENFDPEQIPRIQSKLDAIMRPIVQQLITDINDGKCIKEMSLRCVVESRVVVTAGSLMHKNPLSLDLTLRSHERSFPVRYSARQTRQTPFS